LNADGDILVTLLSKNLPNRLAIPLCFLRKKPSRKVLAAADGGERSEPPERSDGPEVPRPKKTRRQES
jgi:hypothetical protein